MEHLFIPDGYASALNLHDTQIGIKTVKDFFQSLLIKHLNLLRVSEMCIRDRGCKMEIAQRDVYTINHDIAKAKRYVEIIREEIENCWQG